MSRATREQLVSAGRTLSLEASVNSGRMSAALLAMEAAAGPLSAGGQGSRGSDMPDPTFNSVGKEDQAADDRRRVEQIVKQQFDLSAELGVLLSAWSPNAEKQASLRGVPMSNENIWCPNHARHGMSETRAPGRKHCDFCDSTSRENDGLMPNRWLLDVKARRRVNSADIAKWRTDMVDEARDQREQRKAEKKARRGAA